MLQHYPTYCEQPADEFEHNIYSKYQCLERRSSASSTTSTGSNESNQSGNRKKYYVSQMSCQLLNNTFHRNWTEQGLDDCGFDDSLTNLNWLHNVNPMKINEQMSYAHVGYPKDRFVSNNNNNYQPRNQHMFHNQNPQLNLREPSILTNQTEQYQFNKPDYKNNPNLKPSFTFAVLISWAMKELGTQKITLSDIYGWITENFAYYRHSDSTWQNSVRHNLSTSKYFQRVSREKDEPGKGGFWRMNPNNLKELDNNLMKIKYNPSSHSIMPIKTEKLPVIGSYGHANINKINNISSTNNKSITIQENPRPTISNLTPVKRSRKSPIRTTPENWDWDEKVPRQVINNNNSIINTTNNKNHNNNNNNEPDKNNYLQYEELLLCDDTSSFSNNGIEFSSIDNSSCDSFPYLSQCPSTGNDIAINTFEEENLGDILTSPMLMEGEEIVYNEDFKSMVYQNDYDLFPTSKDDLQELNTLLGIY